MRGLGEVLSCVIVRFLFLNLYLVNHLYFLFPRRINTLFICYPGCRVLIFLHHVLLMSMIIRIIWSNRVMTAQEIGILWIIFPRILWISIFATKIHIFLYHNFSAKSLGIWELCGVSQTRRCYDDHHWSCCEAYLHWIIMTCVCNDCVTWRSRVFSMLWVYCINLDDANMMIVSSWYNHPDYCTITIFDSLIEMLDETLRT